MEERKAGRRAELVVLGGLIVAATGTGLWSLHLEPAPRPAGSQFLAVQSYSPLWTTRLGNTTCDDWVNRMTPEQRSSAASSLLIGARARDGQRTQPASSLTTSFDAEISRTCLKPTSVVTAIAGDVYDADHSAFSR